LGIEHHVLDRGDFVGGELAGRGSWTRGAVVEAAALDGISPAVISRGRKAEDAQNHGERQRRLGAGDRAQNAGLGDALGKPLASKAETGYPKEREKEPDDGGESPRFSLHLVERIQQLLAVLSEHIEADDWSRATSLPRGERRARNPETARARRQRAGLGHMLAEPVVICAAFLRERRHLSRFAERVAMAIVKRNGTVGIIQFPRDIHHVAIAYGRLRNVSARSWAAALARRDALVHDEATSPVARRHHASGADSERDRDGDDTAEYHARIRPPPSPDKRRNPARYY
jgi:hypothetical protein